MLLHRYTVSVILSANWIPFYNSVSVFDRIPLSIYAVQCYMYLWRTVSTAGTAVQLLFVYNGMFIAAGVMSGIFICVYFGVMFLALLVETCLHSILQFFSMKFL